MARREKDEERPATEIVVPVDPVNEQVILAAAMVSREARSMLLRVFRPDHFLVEAHPPIWAAFEELERRKLDYDPATVLRIAGDKVDASYLALLVESRPDLPENLDYHIEALHWDKQRAIVVNGPLGLLLDAIKNPREQPERVRVLARQVGEVLSTHGAGRFLHEPAQLVREQMVEIDQRIAGRGSYPYGIPGMDYYEAAGDEKTGARRIIPGAAPGMITVVTAVSGGGKSTYTAHIALGVARQRRRVLFGSWEMSGGMTLELLACIALGWSRTALMEGRITPSERVTLEEKMHAIGKWVTFMRNPFRRQTGQKMSNERNLDIIQEHIVASGCEVFIADLWKRCLRDARPEEEEDALMRQQAMAEETKVHCVLLQQQRLKDIETRSDKRPTRDGIKGSSAWVEIADTIIAPHRPALFKKVPDDVLEVFVLKQRYGKWPLGISFAWDADTGGISGGRSIEYDQAGQGGGEFDQFIPPSSIKTGPRKRGEFGRPARS